MNRLRLFISVGICSILFSGCWFFTTEQKQEPKQEVKLEPCDKMPEELATYLDKIIKGNADNDSVYLRAKETKNLGKIILQAKDMQVVMDSTKRCVK